MKKIEDSEIIGVKYNRLTPEVETEMQGKYRVFKCSCECGEVTEVRLSNLRNSHIKSCGCLNSESAVKSNTIHGMSKHYLFRTWTSIVDRCYNKDSKNHKNYGGRGIKMHNRWKKDPKDFCDWIEKELGCKPDGHSLDRVNNNGNYEPENLRWASREDQANNMRRNKKITHAGKTMTIAQWARETGLRPGLISSRLKAGWEVEKTLNLKPNKANRA